MLLHTVLISTLSALALARSPPHPNPDPNPCQPTDGELIKATWIAPRTFPNCGFAGVGCGSALGPNGKRQYYCAPFKATCCQRAPEPRERRSRVRRQDTESVDTAEEQAEADKQVQDVSKDREDDGDNGVEDGDDQGEDGDEGDEPLFGKPDGKRSYCPDGWCKRRPGATINTNVPGSTKTETSSATSSTSTSKHVWTASYLGTSVTLVNTIMPVKPPVKPTATAHVKID
ncbi:hypothetical protein A1Q2_04432 [Trichosporon asahii var. asahii CBS 8904]|uniref:CBM1 domain-containing protein n=1 Tax=Trichosporon asahii var. asahii (strain CBS 8904) TaxID=1220162 RepID=K1VB61_TRIAC|nr:hypothetical protein A1Q2_04432 [Trichosporon asahii var. asahii CBS 8904]